MGEKKHIFSKMKLSTVDAGGFVELPEGSGKGWYVSSRKISKIEGANISFF